MTNVAPKRLWIKLMDFDITISAKSQNGDELSIHSTTEQFSEAMEAIQQATSQWNNFLPDEPLYIVVKKVPNNTETLGVQTAEKIDLKAIFGRP